MQELFLRFRRIFICLLVPVLAWPAPLDAYSVLSHEAIIDVVWESHIKKLLQQRYPQATEDELSGAQAYAYGGAIIQDMGYYPHGSHFFSNLTHYVRSGDFVLALLRDASTVDEYAFALGAMAHYAADNSGHRIGTNRAVPLLYPRLKKKFGDSVAYEQDPLAHVKTEFGFDVLQVAKERYAPDSYHDFIGFEVSRSLLQRAFCETYGSELNSVLDDEDKALASYRYDVSKLIPKATRIAWTLKKKQIKDDIPDITRKKFLFNLKRAQFNKQWGKDYHRPSAGEIFLAFLFRLVPKIGPLRILEFRTPTPETEKMFEESFNSTVDEYKKLLEQAGNGQIDLPNDNFDVGEQTAAGKYALNDETHADLLHELAAHNFANTPEDLRKELLIFFGDPAAPYATRKNAVKWSRLQSELHQLTSEQTGAGPSPK